MDEGPPLLWRSVTETLLISFFPSRICCTFCSHFYLAPADLHECRPRKTSWQNANHYYPSFRSLQQLTSKLDVMIRFLHGSHFATDTTALPIQGMRHSHTVQLTKSGEEDHRNLCRVHSQDDLGALFHTSGFPYCQYDVNWQEVKKTFLAFIYLVKISPRLLKAKSSETVLCYSFFFLGQN